MSESLYDKKAKRFKFLHALYEKTGGDEHSHPNMSEIGSELGLSKAETELVVQYLKGEHLLKYAAMGGYIAITHYGVRQVEDALSAPERPTQYFPPVINILHVGTISGSQIQQAGSHSSLTAALHSADVSTLAQLTGQLREAFQKLSALTDRNRELEATIATLEAQVNSPSPNATIIREALKTVRSVLEGMGGSLLASGLLQSITRFLAAG